MFVLSSPVIKQRNISLVLFFLAVISSGTFHFINNFYLGQSAPDLLRENTTVITSDEVSYIRPVENWLAGNEWKTNQPGKSAITARSPGYGIVYAVHRSFLSEKAALKSLVVFQIFLFAFAVALIPKIGLYLGMSLKLSTMIALVIAVPPTFSGFLSYTLTEAITPSLVLIFLYSLFRFYTTPKSSGIPTALILGFLILVRPPMIIWIFSVVILGFGLVDTNRLKNGIALVLIALLPIVCWQAYISIKTGELQSLHPIYQDDANDLYRPLHSDIWNFHKSWGQSGQEFNASVNALWGDAMHQRSSEGSVSRIMKTIRLEVIETIGHDELEGAYFQYFELLKNQVPFSKNSLSIPGITDEEKELSDKFVKFRNAYVRKYPFQSFVVVPLKVYWSLGAHSNLSLYVFQQSWRGNPVMEMLRYASFMLHFGVFILFPFALLYMRKSLLWLCISIPILMYLIYLCVVQRGVEERYTLPVLIPMLMLVIAGGVKFVADMRRIITK